MAGTSPTLRLAEAIDEYATSVHREVVRLLARRRAACDVDDIALDVVERFLRQAPSIMARYPVPERYAGVAAGHAAVSFDRRERVQRGEGVRLVRRPDGTIGPRRQYLSGNVALVEGGDDAINLVADTGPPVDVEVIGRLDGDDLLERCLAGVARPDRDVLLLVDGAGYSVQEVATTAGVRRETMSRRIGATRRVVQRNRTALGVRARGA